MLANANKIIRKEKKCKKANVRELCYIIKELGKKKKISMKKN